ncbi:hypothetical protein ACI1UJ_10375 [Lactococcus petauri]|uniref:hypothetical protein n=1 Tax=Lactococcus petauri TaxID=1940789 RepID=UPI00385309EC
MSKEIKCPICQGVSTLRYNENRTYMSHCHDINCFELVTVTASSEAVAEELFSKFENGTIRPKLSIPKKIAEMLNQIYEELDEHHANIAIMVCNITPYFDLETCSEIRLWLEKDETNSNLMTAYFACKALGVEFVEVEE